MSLFAEKTPEIEAALAQADSIAFDGCHKIYVLMDKGQTQQMQEYGYEEGGSSLLRLRAGSAGTDTLDKNLAVDKLREWWDESCCLKFISTVRTVAGDPNEGFGSLISQWENDDEEEEDES